MRSTKISLAVWILVVLVQVAAFGGTYLLYSRHYVSTSNAQVDGDQMTINAPATGTVVRWDIRPGSQVAAGQVVGRVRLNGGNVQPQQVIRAPGAGQITVSRAVQGQFVQAGTQLAIAYPNGIYVTARVRAEQVGDVRIGAPAEVHVDAYPDATVTGVVSKIDASTAGEFSIYPSPDQNVQNPQSITQYVPVRIAFTSTGGAELSPGMNVTVRIRRDEPLAPAAR